jgi:cell division protein FtsQ
MSRGSRGRRSNRARSGTWSPLRRMSSWYHDASPMQQRLMSAGGAFALVATATALLAWAHKADVPGRISASIHAAAVDMSLEAGFAVRDVYVAGRKETAQREILAALGVKIGDPILYFDAAAARERLIELGWVEDARIERRLPGRIVVTLKERTPIAIWQRNRKFVLVDRGGHVIGSEGLEHYPHLKIIIGDDAPKHAADLLAMLEREPEMMRRVTHATWVSGRQWTIRIENAIDVRLPAENPEAAWRKLAEMERDYGVLQRDITAVDLRVPEHTTVRKNRNPQPAALRGNQT